MTDRRSALFAALAAAFLAAGAHAVPTISTQILQCDGGYTSGTGTHTPSPLMRATVQDAATGLRIGTANMGQRPGSTRALWRFDAAVDVANQACSGNFINTFYSYSDGNGSEPLTVGHCIYSSAGCTGTATLSSSPQVPVNFACPASTPTAGTGVANLFATGAASTYPSGSFGKALTLNGSSQYAGFPYLPNDATFDLPVNYTLAAWIKTGSATSQVIISQRNSGNWGFGISAGGGLRSFDSRDAAAGTADSTLGSGLTNGQWHLVHIVRRNGAERRFYADGKLLGTVVAASSSTFAVHPTSAPTIIGADSGGTTNFFNGQIDEIRITDDMFSDDDILLEYAGTLHKYSSDAGVHTTTAAGSYLVAPANGTTAAQTYLPGEPIASPASNSIWTYTVQNVNSQTSVLQGVTATIDTSKPVAPALTATASSLNDINWTWSTPSTLCVSPGTPAPGPYYQLVNCATGIAVTPASAVFEPTRVIGENYAGLPNQLECRRLVVTDVWGTGSLSAPTSGYTHAAAPTGVTFTGASISTGGFIVSWNANSNPSYTRYEIIYALDSSFNVSRGTRAAVGDDYTATSAAITGLLPGTTYFVRVKAFDGRGSDFYGGTPTATASGSVVTDPGAPALQGVPNSTSQITWTWSVASGATGYTLLDSNSGAKLFAGANTTKAVTALSVNTRYDAEVQADMPSPTPASERGHAFTYTWANPPVGLTASQLYHSSATFTWGANGNPVDTFYELIVASEPTFGVVVATLSVTGTTVTATGLLPATAYYAHLRAFNGMQIPTALAAPITFTTPADALTSVSAAPSTPYVNSSNLVASWQFDEGSGASSADSSGNSNPAQFGCSAAACASTPTFAAGPPGLGTAASFGGLTAGAVVSASGAPFDFADDLTVEAWVYPQSGSQINKAGIVARGADGAEDFALDVTAVGAYRFTSAAGFSATVATAAIVAGQWTYVTGVYSAAAGGKTTLYLNGVAAAVTAGPGARALHAGQPVAVGNRKDGSGNYTLPFLGRVDSVRVFHRALSAAQVLAEYTGGFVSTVTAPSPNTGVLLALPPNAFGAPADIFISADPINHPIRVPATALNSGLATPPAGLTMVPNSLIEVVPVVGGVPFTTTLGSSATLTVPYLDANGDNLIDNTNPPLAASKMLMYTLNTTVNRWELLPTFLNASSRRASGVTPHFSVFALFAPTSVGTAVAGVSVYPVPWKPGSGGRFDGPGVTFAKLPSAGNILILTINGRRVRELTYSGASAGTAVWDGNNDDGRRVASGVYFAKITSASDQNGLLVKFAIER